MSPYPSFSCPLLRFLLTSPTRRKYNVIPLLTELARNAVKEKVIRVVVATFRNLVTKAPEQNLASMLIAKVLPFVTSLASRKWSDDEIKEDVDFLVEELKTSFEGLTTYDEYTSELESGRLSWSPPHKNDEFWRDNASKLNDKDRKQLKCAPPIFLSCRPNHSHAFLATSETLSSSSSRPRTRSYSPSLRTTSRSTPSSATRARSSSRTSAQRRA